MAGALGSHAGAQAANLALRIGSDAADAIAFTADLGEELPLISPVLKTLKVIREKVETVKSNREELTALEERCRYMTACVVVKCGQNSSSEIDMTPLMGLVNAMVEAIKRCGGRGRVSRVLKASSDRDEIAGLNARVDRVAGDLGLAGIAVLEAKTDGLKAMLELTTKNQAIIVDNLQRPRAKLATVPQGTPARKSWHVERRHVLNSVFEALSGDGGPGLVGLVGDSGAGKTTAASEIVRSAEMRKAFSDGIVWLTVNDGAKERLPALMMQLARMVYEDIGGSVGCAPSGSNDSTVYVKQFMERGHGGKGLRCLVVADNVWEGEVVSRLLETGMWVLISTRSDELVTGAQGVPVGVDELSKEDARSVLRKAAELSPEMDLPDDAVDLIELCGRVAMDVAFVGRWSTVRGRQDRTAWSDAAGKVRAEMGKMEGDPATAMAEKGRAERRKAILRAGFEDLAIGSDDERVQRLYLSLAVMPDGDPFSVKDATVLLYDRTPSAEDEKSLRVVVEVLERWSILRSGERWLSIIAQSDVYYMHDAHSSFARENLMDRGNVRRPALARWLKYISSLDALRSYGEYRMRSVWLAVEQVGAEGWAATRPYATALARMADSDPLFWENTSVVVRFQKLQADLDGAIITCRRLLDVRDAVIDQRGLRTSTLNDLSGWFQDAGRLQEAEEVLRHSLAINKAKFGREDLHVVGRLYDLGACVREAGRLEEAEELLRHCLAIEEANYGPNDAQLACTLLQLGVCVRDAGRLEEAEEVLRRCLAIEEAKLGTKDTQVADTLFNLGACLGRAGREEEAEELLRRCLAIKEAKLGFQDVQVSYVLHELCACVRDAGRLEEEEALLKRCLAIEEAELSPGHVRVAYTLNQLGVWLLDAGRQEEAEEVLRRCLAIEEVRVGSQDGRVSYALYWLGVCVREAGQLHEAEQLLRRCLSIVEAEPIGQEADLARTMHQLSVCVRDAGRLGEAEELIRRVLGIVEAKLGRQVAEVDSAPHHQRKLRQQEWLDKAKNCLQACLAVDEPKLRYITTDADKVQQELGVFLREADKLN